MSDSPYLDALRRRVRNARRIHADMAKYDEWLQGSVKTAQVNFRISKADLTAFKALARGQGRKYQTMLAELIRREIDAAEGGGILEGARVREPY